MTGVPPDYVYQTRRRRKSDRRIFLAIWAVCQLCAMLGFWVGRASAASPERRCVPQLRTVYYDGLDGSRSELSVRWPRGCRIPS